MSFPKIDPKQSFPQLETEILKLWQDEKVFEKTIERDAPQGEFKFFDGPPFATGLPHYGHILQGVIKDLIPRYKTMKGYRVPRVWGWDCHGLPVENLIEKDLGLKSKQDVEKYGVGKFNEKCRESVLKYAGEWQKTVERMGRWIDMDNAYKTMDLEYMNSVWWVFGELWSKGLIYQGLKPMHVCPRCETPLSNFEVGLGYRDITDLSAIAKFKLEGEENTYLLAWTTTPWTLLGNVALAVNPEVDYVKVKTRKGNGYESYIVAKEIYDSERGVKMFNQFQQLEDLEVPPPAKIDIEEIKGKDLVGKTYEPLFAQATSLINLGVDSKVNDNSKDNFENVPGLYFITFNTENGVKVFEDEKLRDACVEAFREAAKNNNYKIYDLAVMSDHVHLVIEIEEGGDSLSKVLQQLKGCSSHELKAKLTPELTRGLTAREDSKGREYSPIWRKGYDKKFIYSDNEYANVSDYIRQNPGKAGLPEQKYDWLATYDDVNPSVKFPKQKPQTNAFKIVGGDFVTTDEGTGIVHIAPAFGEDDYEIAKKENLPIIQHVSLDGKFIDEVGELAGLEVKPAKNPRETDEKVVALLEKEGKLFAKENYKHSYPHCWRCETPLLNYATSSWFVNVEKIKKDLIKNNQDINWIPDHIRDGRFGKWLEGARDWAISRNRFWGAPLPIWRCEKCEETVCLNSKEELEKLSGEKVSDLHKHFVDEISWKCKCGKKDKVEMTFVRHGETDWNLAKRWQGRSDIPLNENGKSQALAKKSEINIDEFDFIISSPLVRAHETAKILVSDREILFDKNLVEKNYGDWEGKTSAEIIEQNSEVKTENEVRWVTPPKGESLEAVHSRAQKFLTSALENFAGKKILVITHGGIKKVFRKILTENDDLHEKLPNLAHFSATLHPRFKRIPEVLDCWFESGSMPYAQFGEKGEANIPADFIGEAQDQTRGWFYTLHVLATAIQGKSAFRNCTCTGLILAEDGEKMSKSKQNFPPPQKIFDSYGADAMRLYLMQSPVTHAEDLRFSERGVEETLRSVLLPLWNTFYFFTTYANADGWEKGELPTKPKNKLDAWILSELNILIREMSENLEKYEIQKAVSPLAKFLDGLTNWYVRRSRRRFWKSESDEDKKEAYATLHHVLVEVSKLLAPITPFLAEKIYRDLTGRESVHLESWPEVDKKRIDESLSDEIWYAREIIAAGLRARATKKIRIKQPLQKIIIGISENETTENDARSQSETIKEELNVKEIEFKKINEIGNFIVKLDFRAVGKRLGGRAQEINQLAMKGEYKKIADAKYEIGGEEFDLGEELKITLKPREDLDPDLAIESGWDGKLIVALDTKITPELELEGRARDLVRVIQDLRKKADYDVSDRIELQVEGADEILKAHEKYIAAETLAEKVSTKLDSPDVEEDLEGMKIGVKKL